MELREKLIGMLTGRSSKKRSRTTPNKKEALVAVNDDDNWKVLRLAAKDSERRKNEGGSFKSGQQKVSCSKLELLQDGVKGTTTTTTVRNGWFFSERQKPTTTVITDYNHYRSEGDKARFEAGSRDRAVSVATVAAYEVLQKALDPTGTVQIAHGDLGENVLIAGPSATASESDGLFVGAKIQIGTAVIELMEANNPCYRFNTQKWATSAQQKWGQTAPDGQVKKWFKSPQCPLNHEINPGIRGWLARVLTEGEASLGVEAKLLNAGHKEDDETKEPPTEAEQNNSSEDAAAARPFKRQRASNKEV
jgi:MOSC domain-containing protein YiiM